MKSLESLFIIKLYMDKFDGSKSFSHRILCVEIIHHLTKALYVDFLHREKLLAGFRCSPCRTLELYARQIASCRNWSALGTRKQPGRTPERRITKRLQTPAHYFSSRILARHHRRGTNVRFYLEYRQ